MELKIKIEAPGLEGAIHTLAQALANYELPAQPTDLKDVKELPTEKEEPTKTTEDVKEEEPEKEETPTVSLEDVRVKLAEVAQKGKQRDIKEIITSFGAKKLSDIPEDQLPEVLEKAKAIA